MAFTFQINSDLEFCHNEYLLKKADLCKPKIKYEQVFPKRLVEIVPQKESFMNWGTKCVSEIESSLKLSPGKRGDRYILDFGRHVVGKLTLSLGITGSAMDAPLTLKLRFAEVPAELSYDPEAYDGWLSSSWIQQELIHEDILPARLELPRRYSFRYLEIVVADTSPKWQVTFDTVLVTAETSAPKELSNLKHWKDPVLQKIQDISLCTLAECMQDVFEDGPKRDRRLWLGDLRLQAQASYCSLRNPELVKRCLYLFGAMTTVEGEIPANVFVLPQYRPDDTFLLDYSLFFISVLYDYLEQSCLTKNGAKMSVTNPDEGDLELLRDLYPIAKRQLDLALKQVSDAGEFCPREERPVFIDWSSEFDKTTAGQAVLIYVLRQFCSLTERYKQMEDVRALSAQTRDHAQSELQPEREISSEYYENILSRMISYAREILYDSKKGLFVSGPDKEVNVASQVWMILADVFEERSAGTCKSCSAGAYGDGSNTVSCEVTASSAKKGMSRAVLTNMIRDLFPIRGIATPYMYHHVAQAFFEAGMRGEALDLIRSYWGKMAALGADTFWEAFDPDRPEYSPYGSPIVSSFCHAWSCTPVMLLHQYLSDEEYSAEASPEP